MKHFRKHIRTGQRLGTRLASKSTATPRPAFSRTIAVSTAAAGVISDPLTARISRHQSRQRIHADWTRRRNSDSLATGLHEPGTHERGKRKQKDTIAGRGDVVGRRGGGVMNIFCIGLSRSSQDATCAVSHPFQKGTNSLLLSVTVCRPSRCTFY